MIPFILIRIMWLRNEPKWYNSDLVLGILDPDLRSAFTSHNHENGANEILCLDSASEVVNLIARSETRYYYKFTVSIGETQRGSEQRDRIAVHRRSLSLSPDAAEQPATRPARRRPREPIGS
jgi:hypothetical protein